MPRFYRALLGSLVIATPVFAQSAAPDAARARPAEVPTALPTAFTTGASATDPLTGEQLARHIASLYVRQADLLEAEASGNTRRYQEILDGLVSEVQGLAAREGVSSEARFREVYSAIMTEYEAFYDEPALDRGEIYLFRDELFAEANAVDGPLLEHVELPRLGSYVPAIPMEVNRVVERSLAFMRRATGHTSRLQSRADTYFPMVERILAEEGVPDELKYLAMVESALNPRAQSHAGAAGMWQFIPATGRAYGLRVTNEVDDRLDPEKATRAAARHLRDLYERFGDWHLALAGYNCNPARIQRAIQRSESRTGRRATFWDIYDDIPNETRGYVPMFIATALTMSNPEAFDLPTAEEGPTYAFDVVPVAGGTSLREVAGIVGVSTEVIEALNPSIRRARVPEQRDPWMLRLPVGSYQQAAAQLDRLAPRVMHDPVAHAARTVQYGGRAHRPLAAGDGMNLASATPRTTERPARRAATPPATPAPERTSVAERVTTPERASETSATPVRTVADVAEEEARTEARRAPARSTAPARARTTTHRVRSGENLTEIARRYGVTVGQIVAANNLSRTTIVPGQRLRIDASAPSRTASARGASATRTTTHRVRSGENLTTIARRYGVTVNQIKDWNNLRSSTIRSGQRLRIESRRSVG